MIELIGLTKTYTLRGKTIRALQDVHLQIKSGEIFGIIGESGAGKSTLLRTINLLEVPDQGKVVIDHVDLMSLTKAQLKMLRRQIGMIFQHFNLLDSRTIQDNIALPLELIKTSKDEIAQRVTSLLNLVHLESHRHHYPRQLSGGQKQRVAIARALATNPRLLLCDEATSALDPKATSAILSLLKDINTKLGVTIVLITHEMEVIKQICHRAAVISQGCIVEEDTVLNLFSKPKSAMTKSLVQKALHLELPDKIKERLQSSPSPDHVRLIRLTFMGEDSSKPLISTLVKTFDITVNIIQANIEVIQNTTVGFTVCELSGDSHAIDLAIAHIESTSISIEVLGYV